MGLSVKELNEQFADEDDDEVFEDNPVTAAVKGESQIVSEPTSSPTSA